MEADLLKNSKRNEYSTIIGDIVSSGSVPSTCTLFSHEEILEIEKVANSRNDEYLKKYIKKILNARRLDS